MSEPFKLFFIGDVVGASGRQAVQNLLPRVKREFQIDAVIANGENAAHGFGLTDSIATELFDAGVDFLTGGNHSFDKKEIVHAMEHYAGRIIRPANYPAHTPGRGSAVFRTKKANVGVINLMGRVFMDPLNCPFEAYEKERASFPSDLKIILVDVHAEATSEKYAMAYFLDGRVSAVVGTHTHVQTADDRIFPKGTGYLSDAGMTGPIDSIIGMKKEIILQRFLEKRPVKMEVADGPSMLQGVIFSIDPDSGKCLAIQRIQQPDEGH